MVLVILPHHQFSPPYWVFLTEYSPLYCTVCLILKERKKTCLDLSSHSGPLSSVSFSSPAESSVSVITLISLLPFSPDSSPSGLYHQYSPETVLAKVTLDLHVAKSNGFLSLDLTSNLNGTGHSCSLPSLWDSSLLGSQGTMLAGFPPTFINAPSQSFPSPISPHCLVFSILEYPNTQPLDFLFFLSVLTSQMIESRCAALNSISVLLSSRFLSPTRTALSRPTYPAAPGLSPNQLVLHFSPLQFMKLHSEIARI